MGQESKRQQRRAQEAKESMYKKYDVEKTKIWISAHNLIIKFPNGLEITYPPFFFLAVHIKLIVERAYDKSKTNEERNGSLLEAKLLLSIVSRFEIDFQNSMEAKVKEQVISMEEDKKKADLEKKRKAAEKKSSEKPKDTKDE